MTTGARLAFTTASPRQQLVPSWRPPAVTATDARAILAVITAVAAISTTMGRAARMATIARLSIHTQSGAVSTTMKTSPLRNCVVHVEEDLTRVRQHPPRFALVDALARRETRPIPSAILAKTIAIIRSGAGNSTVVPSLRTRCAALAVAVVPTLPRPARLRRRRAVHRALGNRASIGITHAPRSSLLTDAIARAASARVFRIAATAHHATTGTTQATRAMKFYPGVVAAAAAAVVEAVAGVTAATAFAIHTRQAQLPLLQRQAQLALLQRQAQQRQAQLL